MDDAGILSSIQLLRDEVRALHAFNESVLGNHAAAWNSVNGIENGVKVLNFQLHALDLAVKQQDRFNFLVHRLLDHGRHPPSEHGAEALLPPEEVSLADQFRRLEAAAPASWKTWEAAFEAGRNTYHPAAMDSLSIEAHREAFYFKLFVELHAKGRTLDIGVGPLAVPQYLRGLPLDRVAGVDPLPPFEPHPFAFRQSVAEFLPWPDASFETVILATSIDHVYLLDVALEEIRRVLTPKGRVLIWTGIFAETVPYDPYTGQAPADSFHLFHPGENWFPAMLLGVFDLIERFHVAEIGYANAFLALERRP